MAPASWSGLCTSTWSGSLSFGIAGTVSCFPAFSVSPFVSEYKAQGAMRFPRVLMFVSYVTDLVDVVRRHGN